MAKTKVLMPVKLQQRGQWYAVNVPVYLGTYAKYGLPVIHVGFYHGRTKWIAYELTTGLMICVEKTRAACEQKAYGLMPRVAEILKSKKGKELAAEFDDMKNEGAMPLGTFMLRAEEI